MNRIRHTQMDSPLPDHARRRMQSRVPTGPSWLIGFGAAVLIAVPQLLVAQ